MNGIFKTNRFRTQGNKSWIGFVRKSSSFFTPTDQNPENLRKNSMIRGKDP